MSKRKPTQSIASFFGAKKQANEEEIHTAEQTQSKKKHHISFDCEIEQMYANETNWTLLFKFDFNHAGTSSNQTIDDQFGETTTASNLQVHVEGTISGNVGEKSQTVEFDVRVGKNGMKISDTTH